MTKGGHLQVFAAVAVVAAFAYACEDEASVDPGGSLVGEDGLIVFTRATRFTPPDFESDLYAIGVDGTDERRLTGSPGLDAFPAWSPDGSKIAFSGNAGGDNAEIYTMKADGSHRTRLTDIPGGDHWPLTWSPDGTRIAFTSEGPEDHSRIFVMNADGSGLKRLTDSPADDAFPA